MRMKNAYRIMQVVERITCIFRIHCKTEKKLGNIMKDIQ